MVGSAEVFQHTPLAMTSSPPSDVTFPPDVALVCVIAETFAVVTDGGTAFLHDSAQSTAQINTITITGVLKFRFIGSGF